LLIDAANAFEMADIKRILSNQITRMRGFNFIGITFPLAFGAFKSDKLGFGINDALFSSPIFKREKTLFEGLQIVSEPNAADPAGGY